MMPCRRWENSLSLSEHKIVRMPARSQPLLSVTWDQVAAFRLTRHHLVERAPAKTFVSVVHDIGGAQAQLLPAAQLSIWSRVRDIQITQIQRAIDQRRLVKASCMRNTLFLVPAQDLAIFGLGSFFRSKREIAWTRNKGVSDRDIDAAIDATLSVLDQPLTRMEIAERASQALGVQLQSIQGGGWGNRRAVASVPVGHLVFPVVDLLHLVAARGVICYGPYRGTEPTFVRADAWIPRWKNVPQQEAESALLHAYLRAFGPATAEDFSMWSGFSFKDARALWAREQGHISPVDVQGSNAGILHKDMNALAHIKLESPSVRLLPYFDTYLLGHRERGHLLGAKHRSKVYRPQGWIAPVVLVDGRIAGVWEHAREKNILRVKVTKFESISRRVTAGIREEAEALGQFLGMSNLKIEMI